ncbi:hypothetical protein P5673_014169 [Acropora cervicornis]|uniref:Uncharacterized protein n=1 Tax=Acropora cervicornis TaxID=6130 RepID=A0AAD9V606_ACRCE|nr:hypothetical protein P5673_014169 [Acropora cervicornis]
MILSSRTPSQRDNVKRMRRLVLEDWRRSHIRGDIMNDNESLDSDYEDDSLSFEQLEFSPESDVSECSSVSTAKSSQKAGRKAMWRDNVITDMVDIICSSEYLRTNLIFRNTSRSRNAAIYTDVVKQLKERLDSCGEIFLST